MVVPVIVCTIGLVVMRVDVAMIIVVVRGVIVIVPSGHAYDHEKHHHSRAATACVRACSTGALATWDRAAAPPLSPGWSPCVPTPRSVRFRTVANDHRAGNHLTTTPPRRLRQRAPLCRSWPRRRRNHALDPENELRLMISFIAHRSRGRVCGSMPDPLAARETSGFFDFSSQGEHPTACTAICVSPCHCLA